jgi:hypothetical protein
VTGGAARIYTRGAGPSDGRQEKPMKKIAIVLGIVALAAALGGCQPNPEEVCSHIDGVFAKDPDAAKYKKFDKANCVSNGEMKKELGSYRTYAKCVEQASTVVAVNECAKAMDASLK